jgi:phosphate butyryltransferase
MLSNKLFEELSLGQEASINRVVAPDDFLVFAHATGNLNPAHLPDEKNPEGSQPAAPAMWVGSLFSAVLGNLLPGAGTTYLSQTLSFASRAHIGDSLSVTVRVEELRPPLTVKLRTQIYRGAELVVDGTAEVLAPTVRQTVDEDSLPGLMLERHVHVERLLAACASMPPLPTAVVAPEEENALLGALAGGREKLILPILIGDEKKIRAVAADCGADLTGVAIENVPNHDAAAARAVELVHLGAAAAVMKGYLHTDELLKHVVKSQGGLRIGRRISHVFVMDAPSLRRLVLVTDAAVNIAPTLEEKVDIIQNAIDLGIALGISRPKVGVLSAVETVNPKIQSTLDAAALSKMAERGQIRGGDVDGPLAMDNALSLTAARSKGIHSLVAGNADILVVSNLEAGNILAKELTYAAQAEGAGLVIGAKVPILLTSRADDERSRLFSCAVAALFAHWLATGESAVTPKLLKEAAE